MVSKRPNANRYANLWARKSPETLMIQGFRAEWVEMGGFSKVSKQAYTFDYTCLGLTRISYPNANQNVNQE